MLQRLTITLDELERQALETIALGELRDLRDQARFILREEFERRGLLKSKAPISKHDGQKKRTASNVAG